MTYGVGGVDVVLVPGGGVGHEHVVGELPARLAEHLVLVRQPGEVRQRAHAAEGEKEGRAEGRRVLAAEREREGEGGGKALVLPGALYVRCAVACAI